MSNPVALPCYKASMAASKKSDHLKHLKETRAYIDKSIQMLEQVREVLKTVESRIQRIERARGTPLRNPWSEESLSELPEDAPVIQTTEGRLRSNILGVRNPIWAIHDRLEWVKEAGLRLLEKRLNHARETGKLNRFVHNTARSAVMNTVLLPRRGARFCSCSTRR